MEIKDCLHLYLNIGVKIASDKKAERKMDTMLYATGEYAVCTKWSFPYVQEIPYKNVTPILRPLSDMTEEERGWWWDSWEHSKKETLTEAEWVTEVNGEPCEGHWTLWTGNIEYGRLGYTIGINNHFTSAQFLWLLSKHFDLFGLIENGLAIDATKVERTSE